MSKHNWKKKQAGAAASVVSDTHGVHRSILSKDEIKFTCYRKKPFERLGVAKGWKEAIEMCEADAATTEINND